MKKRLYYTVIVLWMVSILLLTGCGMEGTSFSFQFNSSAPKDSEREKAIHFDEAHSSVVLDVDLKIDTGSVSVEIKKLDGETISSSTYKESGKYQIELKDIYAGEDCTIFVRTNQTKKVTLKMTSSVSMIKSKEMPGIELDMED